MHRLLLGIATSALLATGALAADLTTAPAPAPTYNSAAFDWSGFYAGIYGAADFESGSIYYGIGGVLGVNAQSDNVVYGVEFKTGVWSAGQIWPGFNARLGVLVDPDVLLFATAGGGLDITTPGIYYGSLGAGIEAAVSNNVSFVGSYEAWFYNGGGLGNIIKAGVNMHF